MKMKKFLLFLTLISIFGYSQNNFKESSVVFKDGEIKKGFVNYVKRRNTPQEFKFKSTIESEVEILDSTKIVSVEITDITKFIFREKIEADFQAKSLSTANNSKVEYFDRFIEVIVDGEYSLCNYSDNQYEEFYYFGNDLKLRPLKTKSFYNDKNNLVVIEEYKTELKANLAKNNPELINKINYTSLNASDLSKLFYIINKKDLAILKAKVNNGFININVTSDLNFIKFYDYNIDYGDKTLVSFGGEIEYVLPYYNNLFAIEIAPSFSFYKDEAIYDSYTNSNKRVLIGVSDYYYDSNNGKKVSIESTTFSTPFNLKIYPINRKVKIYTSFTLFNLFSAGKGKMNFENEPSITPNFVPPFYGFFEIGGSYKKFGFSFKRLRKLEDEFQGFSGYAVSLKYTVFSSKK